MNEIQEAIASARLAFAQAACDHFYVNASPNSSAHVVRCTRCEKVAYDTLPSPRPPSRWQGAPDADGDSWGVEIQCDRFRAEAPFVVSLWIEGENEKEGTSFEALATPTPAQAREMAAALLRSADSAERATALDPPTPTPDPVRVGARVRVVATGRTGLVVVDFGDGSYSVKLDDGWGSDIVARDGLTMGKDESR